MVPVNELEEYPRPSRRLRLIAFSIALALIVAAISTLLFRPAPRDELDTETLPSFSLSYLTGRGSLTSDDLSGSPVVLNFWASWCGPCREEAPAFQDAWERYEPQGVTFVGVNVCDLEPEAKEFVAEFRLTYPIVRDPDQELADALGIECRLPQTFFVDADGRFLSSSTGEEIGGGAGGIVLGGIEAGELEAKIDELLSSEGDA